MPGKEPFYVDFSDVAVPWDEMPGGEPFELTVDFSNPRRNEVDPEHVLSLWLEMNGVARADLPSVNIGDKRHFRVTLPDSEREATGIFECVRMTTDQLFFLPAGA